ncbi:pentatricopeptide repeat-containing protein At1g03540 [Selaginella moellendorffii]|uniref:pentatricopeptide repeat-containing protein At1g03540 n=1 Tax=Selaginella moellendorffii TaxID=88036 RepID=UPI000D1C28C8|nr:pentatricopeptide repeat-containing protein At1g03540 [Selaginella moellendorffii]|eukprot:XP_024529375.1 pentatricopeptide repeat-containing protein At1g03540 [Selaginella moellendorffii]
MKLKDLELFMQSALREYEVDDIYAGTSKPDEFVLCLLLVESNYDEFGFQSYCDKSRRVTKQAERFVAYAFTASCSYLKEQTMQVFACAKCCCGTMFPFDVRRRWRFPRVSRRSKTSSSASLTVKCAKLSFLIQGTSDETRRGKKESSKFSRRFLALLHAATADPERHKVRSWIAALKSSRDLQQVREIHALAAAGGKQLDSSSVYLGNTLVAAYGRLGSTLEARALFQRMESHTVVSWNSLMLGYVGNGESSAALECLESMRARGFLPDARTLVVALKACGGNGSRRVDGAMGGLERAMALHALAVSSGYGGDIYVLNTLVAVYGRLGSLADARSVFEGMENPDVVSWNAMIQSYADNFREEQALQLFQRCSNANSQSFVAAVKASTRLPRQRTLALETGMALHARARESGCESNVFVGSSLIDMYSSFASMADAHRVFQAIPRNDVVSWTSLVLGYAENGEPELALEFFQDMQRKGVVPNAQAFVAALKACAALAARSTAKPDEATLQRAMALHSQALAGGHCSNIFVATSLVDLYANCGSMADAQRIFDAMDQLQRTSLALWNALLLGYAENGDPELVLELFPEMELELQRNQLGRPNSRSFLCAFKACGAAVALSTGKAFHARVCRLGLLEKPDSVLATCVVDFYAKCGSLDDAQQVFDSQLSGSTSTITWTALMAGYSRKGDATRVLELYREMEAGGIEPSSATLLSILTACNHAGKLEEAKLLFAAMRTKYGITPGIEHYHCVIDVLGRADDVRGALEMASAMPCEADAVTWMTLLGACWKRKDAAIAKVVFDALLNRDGSSSVAGACSIMASIYS